MSPPRKKPLILKDNDFNNNNSIGNNNDDSSLTSQTTVEVKAGDGQVFSVVFRGQLKVETTVCPQEEVKSQIGPHLKQTDVPSQVCVTSSEPSSGGLTVDCSDAPVKSEAQEPVCAFPHDPSATATSAAAVVLELGEDSSQTGHAGHNSIAITPIVCLQVGDEQERGEPRETEAEGSLDKDEVETEVEVEGEGEGDGEGEGEGEHAYLCEHSYSRQDLDHEQLWSRIAALHAKITELDQREEETLAKIQAAEGELTQLRKQNIVCEEKQKALEEYFTSVFLQ